MLVVCGLIIALSSSQASQSPAESTGRVDGRIIAAGTNSAVAGVRVTLFPTGPMGQRGARGTPGPVAPLGRMGMGPPETVTDQDGRFTFPRIRPGTYRVDGQKTGFVSLNQPDRQTTIDVVAGRTTEVALQIQKGAAITGRVLDPSGEPMPDLSVMVLRHVDRPAGMASRLLPAGVQGQTNDLGEFRVSGLPPGEYYIVATPRGRSPFGGAATTPSSGTARTTFATTFYPGTADEAAALPVAVAAGGEVGNIAFTMQSLPAFRISGIVVDEKGEAVSGAMVMLMPDPRRIVLFSGGGGGQSQADGRFTIGDVTAGTYRLSASVPIMMGGRGAGGGAAVGGSWVSTGGGGGSATVMRTFGAAPQSTEVTVTDANVSGVRVVVQRPGPQ